MRGIVTVGESAFATRKQDSFFNNEVVVKGIKTGGVFEITKSYLKESMTISTSLSTCLLMGIEYFGSLLQENY